MGAIGLPSTSVGIDNATTLLVTATRQLDSEGRILADFVAGLPLKIHLHANGLGQKIGTVRQYNPAVMVRYIMGKPSQRLRPFVGVGATYVWYDKIKFNSKFKDTVSLGNSQASVTSKLTSDFQPVVAVGATYNLSKQLEMVVGVAYTPISTESTVTSTFPDGSKLDSGASVQIDPIIGSILFGYKF